MEDNKKYYTVNDVRALQTAKLDKLGIPVKDAKEVRTAILKMAKELLMNISKDFEALSIRLDMSESLNENDFSRLLEKISTPLPIDRLTENELPGLIQFLTITKEDELKMVLNK